MNDILKKQYGARNWRLKKRKITYSEFLKSKKWIEVKTFIENTPKYKEKYSKCVVCGEKRDDLHHTSYTRIFIPSLKKRLNHIVPLCRSHHNEAHEITENAVVGLGQVIKKIKKSFISNTSRNHPSS